MFAITRRVTLGSLAILFAALWWASAPARAADPIKVGFSMALTGAVAPNGKQNLLALELWRDDVNAKGGLLGRPVELVYYDDQSNPNNVPGKLALVLPAHSLLHHFRLASLPPPENLPGFCLLLVPLLALRAAGAWHTGQPPADGGGARGLSSPG
jgi:hypothetical protein